MKRKKLSLLAITLVMSLSSCKSTCNITSTSSITSSTTSSSTSTVTPYSFNVKSVENVDVTNKDTFLSALPTFKAAYFNGEDIPYLDIETAVTVINHIYGEAIEVNDNYTVKQDNKIYTIESKNGETCVIDFEKQTITFSEFGLFIHDPRETTGASLQGLIGKATNATDNFINIKNYEYYRGSSNTFNLLDYSIDLPFYESKGYIPFATLQDIFLQNTGVNSAIINKKIYCFSLNQLSNVGADGTSELTDFGKTYYSELQGKSLTDYLVEYNYNETCFALDNFYGLKKEHGIDKVSDYFKANGIDKNMLKKDAKDIDQALADFLATKFSDLHTSFSSKSAYTGDTAITPNFSISTMETILYMYKLMAARKEGLGLTTENPTPDYYSVVDDTAFITFDSFTLGGEDLDTVYNSTENTDTIHIMKDSLEKIKANADIKKVVLDLSLNGGGQLDAALDVVSAMTGRATMAMRNKVSGASMYVNYNVDVNLDGVIDDNDHISDDIEKYVLVSNFSFSCGNYVPSSLQEQGVTIIGATSGGGSCSVLPCLSPIGTGYSMSSPNEICKIHNAKFESIDEGVTPDIRISNINNFYNRTELVTWLATLK